MLYCQHKVHSKGKTAVMIHLSPLDTFFIIISHYNISSLYERLFQYISNKMQRYTVYFIWKLLYMFRVVPPPIIRSANNCIYSIWYLSHCYCYLSLLWKSQNRFECAVGGICHPQHTQTSSKSSTIATGSSSGVTNTRCCRYSCLRS